MKKFSFFCFFLLIFPCLLMAEQITTTATDYQPIISAYYDYPYTERGEWIGGSDLSYITLEDKSTWIVVPQCSGGYTEENVYLLIGKEAQITAFTSQEEKLFSGQWQWSMRKVSFPAYWMDIFMGGENPSSIRIAVVRKSSRSYGK